LTVGWGEFRTLTFGSNRAVKVWFQLIDIARLGVAIGYGPMSFLTGPIVTGPILAGPILAGPIFTRSIVSPSSPSTPRALVPVGIALLAIDSIYRTRLARDIVLCRDRIVLRTLTAPRWATMGSTRGLRIIGFGIRSALGRSWFCRSWFCAVSRAMFSMCHVDVGGGAMRCRVGFDQFGFNCRDGSVLPHAWL
jgi:hypothetical protein